MARPPKLSPSQREDIARRLSAGEGVRALARDFGVGVATISRVAVSEQTEQVLDVARQLVDAQNALDRLTPAGQRRAICVADKLVNVTRSLATAAVSGSATAVRLHALANSEVAKVDDADPLASVEALRNVGVLTKLGNASAEIAVALLNANTRAKCAEGLPRDKNEDEAGSATALVRELKQRRAAGGKTAMVPGMATGLDDEG